LSWQPHLFRMDKSTGSPPDLFDPNGQNWGFPTYNWDAMAEEDFKWCEGQRVLGRPWPLDQSVPFVLLEVSSSNCIVCWGNTAGGLSLFPMLADTDQRRHYPAQAQQRPAPALHCLCHNLRRVWAGGEPSPSRTSSSSYQLLSRAPHHGHLSCTSADAMLIGMLMLTGDCCSSLQPAAGDWSVANAVVAAGGSGGCRTYPSTSMRIALTTSWDSAESGRYQAIVPQVCTR